MPGSVLGGEATPGWENTMFHCLRPLGFILTWHDLRTQARVLSISYSSLQTGSFCLEIARRRCARCEQGGRYQLKTRCYLPIAAAVWLSSTCFSLIQGYCTSLIQDSLGSLYTSSQMSPAPALGNQGTAEQLRAGNMFPQRSGPSSQNHWHRGQWAPLDSNFDNGRRRGSVVVVASPPHREPWAPLPRPLSLTGDALLTLTAPV